jgi:hypothetical protein
VGAEQTYVARLFLSYNSEFEVVWRSQYITQRHPDSILRVFREQTRYADRAGGGTVGSAKAALTSRRPPRAGERPEPQVIEVLSRPDRKLGWGRG